MKQVFVHLISNVIILICVSLCDCTESVSSYLLNLNEQHIMAKYNSLKNTTQQLHTQINLLKREYAISKTISELQSTFPNISTIPVKLSAIPNHNNDLKVISSFSSVNRNKCMYSDILEITIDNYKAIYTVLDNNGNKVLNVDILEIPTLFFICIDNTKNNIHLLTQHGALLSSTVLFNETNSTASNKRSIAVVDFSLLTDDLTINILTSSNDIISLKLAVTITYNNSNRSVNGHISVIHKAETNIPLSHSLLHEHDSVNIHFSKNRFRGGKYISVAYTSGEIFVYSSTLSSITAIHLHKTISKVKVIQGILFVCEGNKIYTFNSLGGNSILVQCETFYNIVDINYDFINGLVFIIDEMKHLVILSTKLTITKPQDNECRVIYRFTFPEFVEVNAHTSLYLQRGILFILTTNYIGVINIEQAKESKRKLAIEHYYLVESEANASGMYGYRMDGNDSVLIVSGGMEVFRYEKEERRRGKEKSNEEEEEKSMKERKVKKGVECNGNKICMVLFNTSSKNNRVNFSLFGCGIGGLFLLSYFFYKKQKEKRNNGNSKEDDKIKEEKLLQVLKGLQDEENKFKRGADGYHNKDAEESERKYKEHEEEEYEYEEEEDEGEETQEQYNNNNNNEMNNMHNGRYNNNYSDEDEEIENDD